MQLTSIVYLKAIQLFLCFPSVFRMVHHVLSRVHNISTERECLTAYIPCTNALRQVSPVNYRILPDLINTLLRITVLLIGDDRFEH